MLKKKDTNALQTKFRIRLPGENLTRVLQRPFQDRTRVRFWKIKNNLTPLFLNKGFKPLVQKGLLLALLLLITHSSFIITSNAMTVTVSSGNAGSGLIGHWPLSQESETTGANLVTNGSFENSTGWIEGSSWTIAGGIVTHDGNTESYLQTDNILTIGKKYQISADILSAPDGIGVQFTSGWGDGNTYYIAIKDVGTRINETITAGSTVLSLHGSTGYTATTIDNISVKEIQTADATPASNRGTIYGPTYTAGPTAKGLDPERVTNGTFDTDSDWQMNANWTISNGEAHSDGTQTTAALLYQGSVVGLLDGKKYLVSVDITDYTAGTLRIWQGNSPGDGYHVFPQAVGTYTHVITAFNYTIFNLSADADFIGSVDNLSVHEIISGQAMRFDGVDDYVDFESNNIVSGASSATLSAWIKPDVVNAKNVGIVSARDSENGMEFRIENDEIACWVGNGTVNVEAVTTDFNLAVDTWYHISCTYDGTTIKIYKDSIVSSVTGSTSGTIGTTISGLTIGSDNDQAASKFNGSIANVRIYDRALSATEVLKLYDGSESRMTTGNTKKGLIAHWPMTTESLTTGSNLVNNGSFNSAAGWSNSRSTLDITNGVGTVTNTTSGLNGYLWQMFPTVIGRSYLVTGTYLGSQSTVTGQTQTHIGTFLNDNSLSSLIISNGSSDEDILMEFIATGTTSYISLYNTDFGSIHVWSDISVKELNMAADATPAANHGSLTNGTLIRDCPNDNCGYSFDGVDDWIEVATDTDFNTGADGSFSYSGWIEADDYTATQSILSRRTGCNNNGHFNIFTQNNRLYLAFYSNIDATHGTHYSTSALLTDGERYHFTWVKKWGEDNTTLYINGSEVAVTGNSTKPGTLYNDPIIIGGQWSDSECFTSSPIEACELRNPFNGTISDVRIYNRLLSADEAAKLYSGTNITSGLVGHWPLLENGNDISGNEHNGTVTGATLLGSGSVAEFDGDDDYIELPETFTDDLQEGFTLSTWINPETIGTSQVIFADIIKDDGPYDTGLSLQFYINKFLGIIGNNDNRIYNYSRTIFDSTDANTWIQVVYTWDGTTSTAGFKSYVNGVLDSAIGSEQGTFTGMGLSNVNATIGSRANYVYSGDKRAFDGKIADTRIYNRPLSAIEITSLYDEGRTKPSQATVGNLNKGLIGHWPLTSESLKTDDRSLDNSGAGTSYVSSTQAYGTWEFDMYKGGDGNTSYIPLMFNHPTSWTVAGTNGYMIGYTSSEQIKMWNITNGGVGEDLFASAVSYIDIDTWYRMKVARTNDGEFTVSIKGGTFGDNDWTLVDTTGGLKTNPFTDTTYTTSSYFVADLDPGDKIRNIHTDNGFIPVDTFTDSTGTSTVTGNKTAADTTPATHHGTIYGADVRNHGYVFDGVDDYIDIPDTDILDLSTEWTLSAWIKRDAIGTQDGIIEKYDWSPGKGGYVLRIDKITNVLSASAIDGTSSSYCKGTTPLAIDTWYHITATFDANTDELICYVNGFHEQINTNATVTPSNIIDASLKIGARGSDAIEKIDGNIADVRVYDRALSASEVQSLYNGDEVAAPIGHWPLDKGPRDISGNANHGTVTGASLVGESASFDGVDDYIDVPGVSIARTDNFTFAGWAYIKDTSISFKPMMTDDGGQSRYALYPTHSGRPLFYHHQTADPYYHPFYGSYWSGPGWHHVGIKRVKDTYAFYQDGVQTTSETWISNYNLDHLTIGSAGTSRYYDGQLSDIRVYDRALSATEMQKLYDQGRP